MPNHLGVYGKPERVYIHEGHDQLLRPAEVAAAAHLYDPDAPRFIPAPPRREEAWCPGCRQFHPVSDFHASKTRPNGLQPYCKNWRKKQRKMGKRIQDWTWYRAS